MLDAAQRRRDLAAGGVGVERRELAELRERRHRCLELDAVGDVEDAAADADLDGVQALDVDDGDVGALAQGAGGRGIGARPPSVDGGLPGEGLGGGHREGGDGIGVVDDGDRLRGAGDVEELAQQRDHGVEHAGGGDEVDRRLLGDGGAAGVLGPGAEAGIRVETEAEGILRVRPAVARGIGPVARPAHAPGRPDASVSATIADQPSTPHRSCCRATACSTS